MPRPSLVLGCVLTIAVAQLVLADASANYSAATDSGGSTMRARACYPKAVTDGPAFAYSFNEDSGTTVEDGSGNGADGALQGTAARVVGSCSTDRAGGYLHLDGNSTDGGGVASLVTTPVTASNPSPVSVEAWFRTTGHSAVIICLGDSRTAAMANAHDRILYVAADGRLRFGIWNGNAVQVASPAPVNDGTWHHAVGVFSATSGIELYLDGTLVAADTGATNPNPYSGWWRIGQERLWGWDGYSFDAAPFTGDLDDVAVYDARLSAAQVADHFAAGR